jgi:hypothetical protein
VFRKHLISSEENEAWGKRWLNRARCKTASGKALACALALI